MFISSKSFPPYGFIPEKFAFGKHDPDSHFTFAGNYNPHLAWGGAPDGTRSFAVICIDPDVPGVGDDVNQEGKVVPVELPRVNFFHWVIVDLPPNVTEIKAGVHAIGITPGGKDVQTTPEGGTVGLNSYTDWFANHETMKGNYYGWDGPGPPWNDARVHAYHFTVFALDVEKLGLHGSFTGAKAMRALRSHVLAQASHVGLYAINPEARAAHKALV
jgi:Raf kinase inhibitor-like YbhB/YbcL family protein